MNDTQTWKIDGMIMNYTQLMEWKKRKAAEKAVKEGGAKVEPPKLSTKPKDVKKTKKVEKREKKLKEAKYDGANSVEKEFEALRKKGYHKLDKADQKRYSHYKKQLGK